MGAVRASAEISVDRSGTITFDAHAVGALKLRRAEALMVFYSYPKRLLFLRSIDREGGVELEKSDKGLVANCAADFLADLGVLPRETKRFEAYWNSKLKVIVVPFP